MKLPDALQRNLVDAELVVCAWSAEADELVVRIDQERGPESGMLRFRGVLHVNLPPTLTLQAIEVYSVDTAPRDFWTEGVPRSDELGDSDGIYLVYGAWGGRYFVIAEAAEYEPVQ